MLCLTECELLLILFETGSDLHLLVEWPDLYGGSVMHLIQMLEECLGFLHYFHFRRCEKQTSLHQVNILHKRCN